jgi:hypothetical protein
VFAVEPHDLLTASHDPRLGGRGPIGGLDEPGVHRTRAELLERAPDAGAGVVDTHAAEDVARRSELGDVRAHVRRPAQRGALLLHVHDRDRRLRRDAGDRTR